MRSKAVVVAASAAALTTIAPAALAARPTAGKRYGGGTIGAKPTASHGDVNFVEINVAKNRLTVNVSAQVNERCTGSIQPNSIVRFEVKGIKLSRSGSFSGSGPISAPGPAGNETGTVRATGRFTSVGRAVGTLRGATTVKLNSGAQGTCSFGTLRYQVDLPGAKGQTGARTAGAAFFGTSRAAKELGIVPVALRLAGANAVAQFATPFYMKCQSGQVVVQSEITPGGKVSRSGRFQIVDTYSQPVAQGITGDFVAKVVGRFERGEVKGTFEQTATIKDAAGKQIDTCATGTLPWKASR